MTAQYSALSTYLHTQSKRHAYGHMFVAGSILPVEFFRATFGGLVPCGSRDLVVAADTYGCAYDGDDVLGRYVVTRRGTCPFIAKALAAQRAGAAGVVVVNNEPGVLRMSMANLTDGFEVVVPLLMVPQNATEPLLRYAKARNVSALHATLRPVRDECVDTEAEDEERRRYADEAEIPYTAALASRIAPAWMTPEKQRQKQKLGGAGKGRRAGVGKAATGSAAAGEAVAEVEVGADGAAPAAAAASPQPPPSDRLPGDWPAAITETVRVHVNAHASRPLGPAGSAAGAEGYLALFSSPVLGAAGPLAFADPPSACSPLTNAASLVGATVVVYRGECPMIDKVRIAQAAGATAALIVNGAGFDGAVLQRLWGERCAELRAAAASLPAECAAYAVDASSSSPTAPRTTHGRSSSGSVAQAVSDGKLAENPVTIPAAMVSADTAAPWVWIDASTNTLANLTGAAVRLVPSRASSLAWGQLEELAAAGPKAWPDDLFHLHRTLLALVRAHYPSSGVGDAQRWAFLEGVADAAGKGVELRRLAASLVWEGGVDLGHASDDFGGAADDLDETVVSGSPGHTFLISNVQTAQLARGADGALRCRAESGHSYTVKLADFDRSSTFGITRRIAELLQQQACLEKLAMHNAASIGSYLRVLREESDAREWRELSRGLLRPFTVPDADVTRTMTALIELGQAVGDLEALESPTTVEAFFRERQERRAAKALEANTKADAAIAAAEAKAEVARGL
jgi:hypothetical protein